jgi:hypothetical protein
MYSSFVLRTVLCSRSIYRRSLFTTQEIAKRVLQTKNQHSIFLLYKKHNASVVVLHAAIALSLFLARQIFRFAAMAV